MKIGDLRHRLELQAYTDYVDEYGKPYRNWSTYATVWGQITPTASNETINGLQLNASTTHLVLIRYRAEILPNHRIKFGDRVFNIQGVRTLDETKIAMGITCEEVLGMSSGVPT